MGEGGGADAGGGRFFEYSAEHRCGTKWKARREGEDQTVEKSLLEISADHPIS
jgi:hypothetical protein